MRLDQGSNRENTAGNDGRAFRWQRINRKYREKEEKRPLGHYFRFNYAKNVDYFDEYSRP